MWPREDDGAGGAQRNPRPSGGKPLGQVGVDVRPLGRSPWPCPHVTLGRCCPWLSCHVFTLT